MAEATIPTSDPIIKAFEYQLDRLTKAADELDMVVFRLGQIHAVLNRGSSKE